MIRKVRNELPSAISDNLPGTHALKRSINRYREHDGPANPATLADLGDIPDEYKYILTRDSVGNDAGRELFLASDTGREGDNRILIFVRKDGIRMLKRKRRWFVDGDFKVFFKTARFL